jgi:hypothetical protein
VRITSSTIPTTLAVVLSIATAGCRSAQQIGKQLGAGSCEAQCANQHPESLYDENRCIDLMCTPPKEAAAPPAAR